MTRPQIGDLIPLWKKAKAESYTRPADWLELPEVSVGDQKVVGLHAVFPHDSNFVAFKCSGAYTVNWGDGTSNNYASGATAYHIFDYADFGSGTECSRGYRQAIVTITPQTGQNLTSIDFNVNHNQSGLQAYSTGWLDVKAAGANITKIAFGGSSIFVNNAQLEIFEFVGSNNITNFSCMFSSCFSLQSIPQLDTSSGNDFNSMFSYCFSLQSIPQLDTSSGNDFNSMFDSCYSLQSIPRLDTSSGNDFRYMFYCCYSLQSIPQLDTSGGTSFNDMFSYCFSLQSIPQLDTSSGTSFSDMFSDCYSLSAGALLGTSIAISYADCRLSRQALVDIFNGLATAAATITITGNWGASSLTTADRAIATGKGWTITG